MRAIIALLFFFLATIPGVQAATWQSGNLACNGITGNSFHYNYFLPPQYSTSGAKVPVLFYLHENNEGTPFYTGQDSNPLRLTNTIANGGAGPQDWYNNTTWLNTYGAMLVMPYADQSSDPSGQTSNFGGYGDTPGSQPNEVCTANLATFVKNNFNVDPNRFYITGDSLGGIGSAAHALDYNAKNGTVGRIWAGTMPFAGAVIRGGVTQALINQTIGGVFQFAINGPGDGTSSNPVNWFDPLWNGITGNGAFPGPPGGGQAGSSPFWYLRDPNLGHDVWDTYRPLPAGKPMLDLLFAQTAGGAPQNPGSPSPIPGGMVSVSGNQFVASTGQNVRLACLGYDNGTGNYNADMAAIQAQGFNCIKQYWFDRNLNLTDLDNIATAAQAHNIRVILDHHGNEKNSSCDFQQGNGVWYDQNGAAPWNTTNNTDGCSSPIAGTVTYNQFKANWVAIATHYNNSPLKNVVIGADLHNEPLTYGTGLSVGVNWGGNNGSDMRLMCSDTGAAVEAADPGILIICEGPINGNGAPNNTVLFNGTTVPSNLTMDLSLAGSNPVTGTGLAGHVAYSIHDYPGTISGVGVDSGAGKITSMNAGWGYLVTQNIAPVFIGEAGASLDGAGPDSTGASLAREQNWANTLFDYVNGKLGASGGPTFSGSKQGISMDYWWFNYGTTDTPDGIFVNSALNTTKPGQKAYWSTILYVAAAGPAWTVPSTANTTVGVSLAIPSVSVADQVNPNDTLTFSASASGSGKLTATGASGNGTGTISFTGTSTALNNLLATVSFVDAVSETSTITWNATDQHSGSGNATTAVAVAGAASPECTTVPPASSITSAGPPSATWGLSNGVVVVNGVNDTTTSNVVKLLYTGGRVYQNITDGRWWSKAVPSDAWSPTDGTATAPTCQPTTAPVVVIGGLNVPWGIGLIPGGDMLVTERDAAVIARITPSTGTLVATIAVPNTVTAPQGGLMGIAVDPSFSTNNFIYLVHTRTYNGGYTPNGNEVVRYTYNTTNNTIGSPTVLFTYDSGNGNNGGGIAFGPDGNLYVSEGNASATAQAGPNGISAQTAAAFINTIGMNTHLNWLASYQDAQNVINKLNFLGIKNVRDFPPNPDNSNISEWAALANAGMNFDFIIDYGVNIPDYINRLDNFVNQFPGHIRYAEGPNEIWNFPEPYNGKTGMPAALDIMRDLHNAVRADPKLSGVPLVNLTTGGGDPSVTFNLLGNMESSVELGNVHIYPQGGDPTPFDYLSANIPWQTSVTTPHLATDITEWGFYTLPDGRYGVNNDVQARFMLDFLFSARLYNTTAAYIYELIDNAPDSGANPELHFGMFTNAGAAKPSATALHNLTTILADPNNVALTGNGINYNVTGASASGHSLQLVKATGAVDVVVWAEPNIWNEATQTQSPSPSNNVTVNLGATYSSVSIYDPMVGTAATSTRTNVNAVTVAVTDHPIIIEIAPQGVATVQYLEQTRGNETNGKIVRLLPATGAAVSTNPYNTDGTVAVAGDGKTRSRTWSFGHRNVQGMTWQLSPPSPPVMWATEQGPSGEAFGSFSNIFGNDKINLITGGANYGWPLVYGPNTTIDQYGNQTVAPALTSGNGTTWAPTATQFVTNSLFVGALGGKSTQAPGVPALDQTVVSGTSLGPMANLFARQFGRIRTVILNPNDGLLYFGTSNTDGSGGAVGTRLYTNQPGGNGSPWNLPIGAGATWSAANDPATIDIARGWNGSAYTPGPYGNINTTANFGGVQYVGQATDPQFTFTSNNNGRTKVVNPNLPDSGSTITATLHIPTGAITPGPYGGGADYPMTLFDPVNAPGRLYTFGGITGSGIPPPGLQPGQGPFFPSQGEWDDATSDQFGADADTGLSGYNVGAGMINACDVNPACNPDYPRFKHALRYLTDAHLFKSNATPTTGQNLNPSGWPDRLQDFQSGINLYSGNLPFGSTLGIPINTTMPTGLDANCQGAFWTMSHYPLFARDMGGGGFNLTVDQVASNSAYIASLRSCLPQLVELLRIMTNQHQTGQSFTAFPANGPGARLDSGPAPLAGTTATTDLIYKIAPSSLVTSVPPVLSAPINVTARLGVGQPISGLSVTSTTAGTFTFSAAATGSGTLSATGATGNGTSTITFSGTLAALNTLLASVTFTDSTVEVSTVTWTVTDPNTAQANANTAVSIANIAIIGCPWCRP